MRRPRAVEVRFLRDLGIAELVLVTRGDVHDAGDAGRLHKPSHRRPRLLRPLEVELPAGLDEVDLRIDVPDDRPTHAPDSTGPVPVSDTKTSPPRPRPNLRLVAVGLLSNPEEQCLPVLETMRPVFTTSG